MSILSINQMAVYAYARQMAADIESLETLSVVHVGQVEAVVSAMLREMGVLDRCNDWPLAASLHDCGKRALPLELLRKPGKLTREERSLVQTHTIRGYEQLKAWAALDEVGREFYETAAVVALTHHENWDGSGYPHGFSGQSIPLIGRLVHVADVLSALASPRVYHLAMPPDDAMGMLLSESFAGYFDPDLLPVVIRVLPELKSGGVFQ